MEPANLNIDILNEEIKELKHSKDNLKSLNDTLSKEIQLIENRLIAAEQENKKLESQCRNLQTKIDLIIEEKESEINELKENCAHHLESQKRLDKCLDSHKKQLNEVKDVLIQAREETARIRRELEFARKREKELKREIGDVQQNLETEIVKNEELREELEDCRSTNKAMKEEIDHLKKEKEAITQKMVRKENDYEDMKTILSYGDLNFSKPLVGADVCSEIFDKENLAESRLSLVNLIHPIDTSLEHLSPIMPPKNAQNRYQRQSGSPITSTQRKPSIRVRFDVNSSIDATSTPTCSTSFSSRDSDKPQFGPFCFLFITFLLFCYTLIVYPLKYTYHYFVATILLPGIKVERISSCQ